MPTSAGSTACSSTKWPSACRCSWAGLVAWSPTRAGRRAGLCRRRRPKPPLVAPLEAQAEIYQDSSGGEHWNRYRDPQFHPRPNSYVTFKGYRTFLAAWNERPASGVGLAGRFRHGQRTDCRRGGLLAELPEIPLSRQGRHGRGPPVSRPVCRGFSTAHGEHKTTKSCSFSIPGSVGGRQSAIVRGFSDPLRLNPRPSGLPKPARSATSIPST